MAKDYSMDSLNLKARIVKKRFRAPFAFRLNYHEIRHPASVRFPFSAVLPAKSINHWLILLSHIGIKAPFAKESVDIRTMDDREQNDIVSNTSIRMFLRFFHLPSIYVFRVGNSSLDYLIRGRICRQTVDSPIFWMVRNNVAKFRRRFPHWRRFFDA